VKKADVIIGIDPDTAKSGVCQLAVDVREVKLFSYTFPNLCDYLNRIKEGSEKLNLTVDIVVEKSWGNSHNTHLRETQSKAAAARTGYNVGRCHQVGICICDYARSIGLNVVEHHPLRKCWKGEDGKITHEELSQFVDMPYRRSSQDIRDAVLLSWSYAGLPIRIKT
jgi:hypothetical protein